MINPREQRLARWLAAGVIDAATADRIRAFEAERDVGSGRRWPIVLALGFGGLLVGAGVLLFVSANWDQMSPASRFATVLTMVGIFHAGGALSAGRFEGLATTLHAVGTVTLGAGIFLAGQIFNLNEHWPSGLLLWALGAWGGWLLRRDWPQLVLAAILTPAWLQGEWTTMNWVDNWRSGVTEVGWFLLALSYLTLDRDRLDEATGRAVFWLGVVAFLPLGVALAVKAAVPLTITPRTSFSPWMGPLPDGALAIAWTLAIVVPLAVAWWLRRRLAWLNAVAAVWAIALVNVHVLQSRLWIYPWLAAGCVGLALWGLREARTALVNLATVGFAITVLAFYFDTVMTKMGRSASLVGLGLLFLVGGYLLERLRRRMVENLKGERT